MWRMNALHASHAWEHRHRDPLAAHALAYLYTDPDAAGAFRLRVATRLFLDGPGRVYVQLTDGTRILCDRLGRDGAGELRSQSTACPEVTFGPRKDLELVDHWRRFMSRPDAYLRHIIDE